MKFLGNELTAKIIGITLIVVTVTVFTGSVTDPVNVTKLFLLGGFAFAALGSALSRRSILCIVSYKVPLGVASVFLAASLLSILMSNAPLSQSFYGVYGRNNGFLLYLLLVILFVSTLSITKIESLKVIPIGLFVAGGINLVYAYWVIAFGDFVRWNNIYGNLLGTLGNPNFIGSFFGIFSSVLFAHLLNPGTSVKMRITHALLLGITFYGIVETRAVQGKVLFVASGGLAFFFWIRSTFKSKWPVITYLFLSGVMFTFSILGTQQVGPFSRFLYKQTVTLRGEYWYAGWKTGIDNPVAGVGFDSLGDWYRRSRRESALSLPGVDTVTNAAHNVYLDLFAFGGFPLFLSYVALSLVTIIAMVRVLLRKKYFESTFVILVCIWVCYQLQSLISINQVGLAIWGWVSSAALIVYERIDGQGEKKALSKNSTTKTLNQNNRAAGEVISSGLKAGLLSVMGLLLTVPPLSADMKWHSAQMSQDVNKVIAALESSYMNPLTTFKFISVTGVLETSKFTDQAHEIALRAVAFNPESYESWRNITLLSKATVEEKELAFANMVRLDPLNQPIKANIK